VSDMTIARPDAGAGLRAGADARVADYVALL
jgi:hypothetical protein